MIETLWLLTDKVSRKLVRHGFRAALGEGVRDRRPLVLIVLVVILLLTGIGNHGPGRHSSGGVGDRTPPPSVTDYVQ
jgi:hypothetical protein